MLILSAFCLDTCIKISAIADITIDNAVVQLAIHSMLPRCTCTVHQRPWGVFHLATMALLRTLVENT